MPIQFLWVLILNVFINAGMGIIIPILPTYLKHDGFSTAGLSLPFFILITGRFVSKYYAGQLITWLGDRGVLIACFILYGSVFLLYPQIHSAWSFTVIRFFEGCVEGVGIICLTDMAIANSGEQRGKLMGYFGSSFGLGFILGPLLGGLAYKYGNTAAMFYSGAVLGFLGLLLSLSLQPKPANHPKTKLPKNESLKWHDYLSYLGTYAPSLLRRALFFSFMILIPLYTTEYLGLGTSKVALFFSGSAILTTILMPFTGKLADKFSANHITAVSLVLMGFLIIAFGFTTHWFFFTVLFVVETLTFAFMLPAGMKVFADKVAGLPRRQDIIGYFGSLTELTTLALAILIPMLYAVEAKLAWGLLGIGCFISAIPFLKISANAQVTVLSETGNG